MKNTTLQERIREITTYHSDDGTSGYLLSEEQIRKLTSLFEEYAEEIIGEDEKPDEYIAKHLSEAELSMATQAVKFHARNSLRAEQRTKLAELTRGGK